jgi:hypothetical protein
MNLQETENNLDWLLELSKDDLVRIIARLIDDSYESSNTLIYDLKAMWGKSDD